MYTQGQRVKMVEFYIETRSIAENQQQSRSFYGKKGNIPNYKTVVDIVHCFQSKESIHETATRECNLQYGHTG